MFFIESIEIIFFSAVFMCLHLQLCVIRYQQAQQLSYLIYNLYMEAGNSQQGYVYTEKEMSQYRSCPQILFVGGHTSGFVNCSYCANIFRTYRRLQNEQTVHEQAKEAEEAREDEGKEEEAAAVKPKALDENGECTKLMCMKAGWCMCQ